MKTCTHSPAYSDPTLLEYFEVMMRLTSLKVEAEFGVFDGEDMRTVQELKVQANELRSKLQQARK